MPHTRLTVLGLTLAATAGVLSGCAGTPAAGPSASAAGTPAGAGAAGGATPAPASSCHLDKSTGLFVGCESSSASTTAVTAPLSLTTYSHTFESQDGFKSKLIVNISPVMLGTDSNALNQAWASVGGSGEVPCTSGTPDNETPGYQIQPSLTGYAFGRITLVNLSPGFTPPEATYILHGLQGIGAAGLGFSDGSDCKSLFQGFNFTPNWTGNAWRVPLVIAVYSYRSPAHPNGDPSKLKQGMYFDLGDLPFPLKPAQ